MVNSDMTLKDSILNGNLAPVRNNFFNQTNRTEFDRTVTGGFVTLSDNSSLTSSKNQYSYGRANYGGCIALVGRAKANFSGDSFSRCEANLGAAIFGEDFSELEITKTTFKKNIAYGGIGEALYANKFADTVKVHKVHVSQEEHNAFFLNDGHDVDFDAVRVENFHMDWDRRNEDINYTLK